MFIFTISIDMLSIFGPGIREVFYKEDEVSFLQGIENEYTSNFLEQVSP
jgi:hypothetical protein